MRAAAQLIVGADPNGGPHRVVRMAAAAPVAWRSTPEGIFMVGTAASPVGDDEVGVDVEVRSGATLVVRSASASVAWRGRGSRQDVRVVVADGGRLEWRPEPLIATGGCDHHHGAVLSLAPGASVLWAEQLVLGRHGEGPGSLSASLSADVGGRPLLRHCLQVGAAAPASSGPAVLGGARAAGLILAAGPGIPALRCRGTGWAVMPLEGPGVLGVAVSPDARQLGEAMARMWCVLRADRRGRDREAEVSPAASVPTT